MAWSQTPPWLEYILKLVVKNETAENAGKENNDDDQQDRRHHEEWFGLDIGRETDFNSFCEAAPRVKIESVS